MCCVAALNWPLSSSFSPVLPRARLVYFTFFFLLSCTCLFLLYALLSHPLLRPVSAAGASPRYVDSGSYLHNWLLLLLLIIIKGHSLRRACLHNWLLLFIKCVFNRACRFLLLLSPALFLKGMQAKTAWGGWVAFQKFH